MAQNEMTIENIKFSSNKLEYDFNSNIISATGNISLRYDDYRLLADQITYNLRSKELSCFGSVQLYNNSGVEIHAQELLINNQLHTFFIKNFTTKLPDNITITSETAKSFDATKSELTNATYTSCNFCPGKAPFWSLVSKDTKINMAQHRIVLKNAFLKLGDYKVLYTPYISLPTPDAPAQHGLLVPIVETNSLRLPIYFRIQSNMDTTITPRIMFDSYNVPVQMLYELEFRHLLQAGEYKVNLSVAPDKHNDQSQDYTFEALKNVMPFYLVAKGDFVYDNPNKHYGVDINFVSNEAYLKKYYDDYTSYLTTKIYTNNFNQDNYYNIQLLSFNDLRDNSIFPFDEPLLLPQYNYKSYHNVFDTALLNNGLQVDSYFIKNKSILRLIHQLNLQHTKILPNNFVFDFDLGSELNLYGYEIDKNKDTRINYIPTLTTKLSYPMIYSKNNYNMIVTPYLNFTGITNIASSKDTTELIDAPNLYLTSFNFFNPNYYSGFDYAEKAMKLLYGFDYDLFSSRKLINLFVGQVNYLNGNNNPNIAAYNLDKLNIGTNNSNENGWEVGTWWKRKFLSEYLPSISLKDESIDNFLKHFKMIK
jgi:LPS-assembly protein